MLKVLFGLFANRDWHARGNVKTGEWQMRRWTDAGWETREATPDEISAASHWQAAR